MKGPANAVFLALVGIALFLSGNAHADHTTFDYEVERFEVTGNLPGSLVDEFDDGILTATQALGTVTEYGGALHLESEGFHNEYPGIPLLTVDRSDAIMDSSFTILNGQGDFTSTATLRNLVFQPGGYFASNIAYDNNGTTVEILSLSVLQGSPEIVAAIDAEYPVFGYSGTDLNLSMTRSIQPVSGTGAATILDHQTIHVPESFLTDDILFTMFFTDSTDSVLGAISLDGGAGYYLLDPVTMTGLGPSDFGVFTLFGDPLTIIPEPSTALLLGLGLIGISGAGRRLAPVVEDTDI